MVLVASFRRWMMLWEMLESPRDTSGLTRLEFPAFSGGRRTPDEDWYEHWRSLTV